MYGNDEAMVQALKSGDIDYAYDIPPTLANSLKGEANIALNEEAADYHTNLAFNFGGQAKAHMPVYGTPPETQETNNPALHDHAVRLAIAHAIDKEQIAQVVFQGAAQPADTFISPDKAFWHLDIPADEEYDFNLDEANQILDDAGYTERTPDGVRIDPKTGDPLVLDILTITNSRGSVKTGELMAGWMDEIGIKFDLRPVSEPKAYVEWENGTFDAYIWSWGGDRIPTSTCPSTSRASASDGVTGAIATPSSTSSTTSRGRRSTETSGSNSCRNSSASTTKTSRRSRSSIPS